MPALEAAMLDAFLAPLVEGKDLDSGPLMVSFIEPNTSFPVTVEKTPSGLRAVVRKPAPPKKAAPPPPPPARSAVAPVVHTEPVATPAMPAEARRNRSPRPSRDAVQRGASDVILSTHVRFACGSTEDSRRRRIGE